MKHPQVLRVRLKASKTDPFRVGIKVSVGRTDKALCSVSAVLAYIYMAVRGPGPGPLFQFQDGRFLTRARLVMEEGSYLSSGSGQLTVLGAQLPERRSNWSTAAVSAISAISAVSPCPSLSPFFCPWPTLAI